jgi:hypothetical protein
LVIKRWWGQDFVKSRMTTSGGVATLAEQADGRMRAEISFVEKAMLPRVSFRLQSFLVPACLVSHIDRTNVGLSALQMHKDIGLSAAGGRRCAEQRLRCCRGLCAWQGWRGLRWSMQCRPDAV